MTSTTEDASLQTLNSHLSTRTTILGTKPSIADIAIYARLAPLVASWTADQRTGEQGYHHIVRHLDFVQNSPLFALKLDHADKINLDQDQLVSKIKPIDAKAEKERKKKEKELAALDNKTDNNKSDVKKTIENKTDENKAIDNNTDGKQTIGDKIATAVGLDIPGVGHKTEKKEKKVKQPKQPKAPAAPEKPLSPALIDLRVGHILKAIQHPNADSLYVSTVAVGDAPGTDNTSEYEGQVVRTVCSGLNGLVPLEEMQGRKIVAVCNLKPVTMRGIKSCAMVLAASPRLAEGEEDNHKGPVELVNIPEGAQAGDRVYFEGHDDCEPEPVLNPKKKIWETFQPGFTTTNSLDVAFDVSAVPQLVEKGASGVGRLVTKAGVCTVSTLKNATVR